MSRRKDIKGQCINGHDILDANNFRYEKDSRGNTYKRCLICQKLSGRARRDRNSLARMERRRRDLYDSITSAKEKLDLPDEVKNEWWRDKATCAGMDPEIWFLTEKEGYAKRVCRKCPVRMDCLTENLHVEYGVYGGMSSRERSILLSRKYR